MNKHIYVCMCACGHVCIYVGTKVRMYVCMYVYRYTSHTCMHANILLQAPETSQFWVSGARVHSPKPLWRLLETTLYSHKPRALDLPKPSPWSPNALTPEHLEHTTLRTPKVRNTWHGWSFLESQPSKVTQSHLSQDSMLATFTPEAQRAFEFWVPKPFAEQQQQRRRNITCPRSSTRCLSEWKWSCRWCQMERQWILSFWANRG